MTTLLNKTKMFLAALAALSIHEVNNTMECTVLCRMQRIADLFNTVHTSHGISISKIIPNSIPNSIMLP